MPNPTPLLVGLIGVPALVVNLSNSLGAIGDRNDKVQTESLKVAHSVAF